MRLSNQSLQGKTVIAADGRAIGEISALFIDGDSWKVESLQVKLHKDVADKLGASRTMFHAGTIEVPARLVQSVSDAVVLALDIPRLRQLLSGAAPEGSTGAEPSAGPH